MNDSEKLKYISALFLSLDNQISTLNHPAYRHKLKQKYNELNRNFKSFCVLLFPKDIQADYDEYANQFADILDKSQEIGVERANAILDAYINNDIIIENGRKTKKSNQKT